MMKLSLISFLLMLLSRSGVLVMADHEAEAGVDKASERLRQLNELAEAAVTERKRLRAYSVNSQERHLKGGMGGKAEGMGGKAEGKGMTMGPMKTKAPKTKAPSTKAPKKSMAPTVPKSKAPSTGKGMGGKAEGKGMKGAVTRQLA